MKILAIETSCDETAIALVEAKGGLNPPAGGPRFKISKNLVASQIKIHRPFGGIVPNLAKREHIKNLPILYRKIFENPKSVFVKQIPGGSIRNPQIQNIDLIAVTMGPGLEPALWTGINFARDLYKKLKIKNKKLKIIGVSHLEGHLYSFLLNQKRVNSKFQIPNSKKLFPAIALLVSGGHTILVLMKNLTHYKKLGETRDDAAGEAFDKVARLLNLSYPGGPEIEKLAKHGDPIFKDFPRPMINQKNYDFSFSGLKTAILYYLKERKSKSVDFKLKANIAASFQKAAFDVLINKTLRAAKEYKAKSVMFSGGVAANTFLKKYLKSKIGSSLSGQKSKLNVFFPERKFCTDNAAIIAVSGYINYLQNGKRRLSARANLNL